MKIGLISDTHGLTDAWEKAMKLFEGAGLIVHAGDILYHPPRTGFTEGYGIPDLADMINSCRIPIVIARGNCDSEVCEELLDVPVQSPYAYAQCDGLRILAQHGHNIHGDYMERLAEKGQIDILVTGHTHFPLIEKIGGMIHVNAGSPSHPKHRNADGVLVPSVGLIRDGRVAVLDLGTGAELLGIDLRPGDAGNDPGQP